MGDSGLEGEAQHLLMAQRVTLGGKAKMDNSKGKWLNGELNCECEKGVGLP